MDYSNPMDAETDPEFEVEIPNNDSFVFSPHACDHDSIRRYPEDEHRLQVILEDRGPLPPPWARFPMTFNSDFEQELDFASVEHVDFYPEDRAIAANPATSAELRAIIDATGKLGYTKQNELFTVSQAKKKLGVGTQNLLGSNTKMSKGKGKCFLTSGLSLEAYSLATLANLCPFATKGCTAACLRVSGHAEIAKWQATKGGKLNYVKDCRIRRLLLLINNQELFADVFERAIESWDKKAKKPFEKCKKHKLCVRMNVLSDISWEEMVFPFESGSMRIFERYPKIQFYDYTKDPNRMIRFLNHKSGIGGGDWPDNYYLTFSWSETNAETAFNILGMGGNVAIAFDINHKFQPDWPLPEMWCNVPVIDADAHDMRFLDWEEGQRGVFCGLSFKGMENFKRFRKRKEAELRKKDAIMGELTGGFFQYADDAGVLDGEYYPDRNITNSEEYIQEVIAGSRIRAQKQEEWAQKRKEAIASSLDWFDKT